MQKARNSFNDAKKRKLHYAISPAAPSYVRIEDFCLVRIKDGRNLQASRLVKFKSRHRRPPSHTPIFKPHDSSQIQRDFDVKDIQVKVTQPAMLIVVVISG